MLYFTQHVYFISFIGFHYLNHGNLLKTHRLADLWENSSNMVGKEVELPWSLMHASFGIRVSLEVMLLSSHPKWTFLLVIKSLYQYTLTREIWELFENEYKVEDEDTMRFLISKRSQILNNILLLAQVLELQVIFNNLKVIKIKLPNPF